MQAEIEIYDHLYLHFGSLQTVQQIAHATGIKASYVRIVLGRLVALGKLCRPERGCYCSRETLRVRLNHMERLCTRAA